MQHLGAHRGRCHHRSCARHCMFFDTGWHMASRLYLRAQGGKHMQAFLDQPNARRRFTCSATSAASRASLATAASAAAAAASLCASNAWGHARGGRQYRLRTARELVSDRAQRSLGMCERLRDSRALGTGASPAERSHVCTGAASLQARSLQRAAPLFIRAGGLASGRLRARGAPPAAAARRPGGRTAAARRPSRSRGSP
jgi:hypothetical protein